MYEAAFPPRKKGKSSIVAVPRKKAKHPRVATLGKKVKASAIVTDRSKVISYLAQRKSKPAILGMCHLRTTAKPLVAEEVKDRRNPHVVFFVDPLPQHANLVDSRDTRILNNSAVWRATFPKASFDLIVFAGCSTVGSIILERSGMEKALTLEKDVARTLKPGGVAYWTGVSQPDAAWRKQVAEETDLIYEKVKRETLLGPDFQKEVEWRLRKPE